MYYSKINPCDIANGVGCRVSLFVSGCTNHCKECFQPETWDFKYGKIFTEETEQEILSLLSKPYMRGLTILGGEPMEPETQKGLLHLVKKVKEMGKDIWCYTGFVYEDLKRECSYPHCEVTDALLYFVDVLVDGRFDPEKKNPGLWFRGSSNQRIIDLRKAKQEGHIVLLECRDRR